jgi:plasmid stabilization system protein ParE
MAVEFHPKALREVEEAQGWYEERSLFAASAFLRELTVAVRRLREAPNRYPSSEAGTRRILLE